MSSWRFALLWAAALIAGCGEPEPVKLGFIGGTSGRVADLGIAGRNGAQLAIELANQDGGIDGRKIELLVRDDEQNPEVARQRLRELAAANVAAVIGPMTSDMAVALLPLIDEHRLMTVSPTATANELGGKDDYFFRAISPAGDYAGLSAQYQYQVLGLRRVAVVFDQRNKAYAENWARDYRQRFEQLGGTVVIYQAFVSGGEAGTGGIADAAISARPDGVVVVANSVDAALLVQQLRRRSATVRLAAAEWAATERFIDLAGAAAEGVVLAQFFDRSSVAPSYLAFRQTYRERFGEEPGFGSVTAFDATNVLIESLSRHPQLSPKAAVMAIRKFAGVQSAIEFDSSGDARRDVFVTVVRNGKYVVVPRQ